MAKKTAKKATPRIIKQVCELWPGQTERFLCSFCCAEFDLTYEPHAIDCLTEPKEVQCPFCGGDVTQS